MEGPLSGSGAELRLQKHLLAILNLENTRLVATKQFFLFICWATVLHKESTVVA